MTKEQAIINALVRQRDESMNALALAAAELDLAQARIKELEAAQPKEQDQPKE